ncbi:P-II family nitrogen regulator [Streptomyces hyaluromycini]|uniref:P-II family nitrogen regulator n=1 Tax=Streptomyces hyaluromycini TaxID=1377993 RepID=A0ABV1X3V2_9ACTN|nr:P-II family nitrogen regulator [Streptomyces hyaluromycini]
MKLITAVLPPHRVPDVMKALQSFGVRGVTVTEVQAYTPRRVRVEIYRGTEYRVDLSPQLRLDILTLDFDAADLVRVIRAAGGRGTGGGTVWVTPVEEVVRIRTRERGPDAL